MGMQDILGIKLVSSDVSHYFSVAAIARVYDSSSDSEGGGKAQLLNKTEEEEKEEKKCVWVCLGVFFQAKFLRPDRMCMLHMEEMPLHAFWCYKS